MEKVQYLFGRRVMEVVLMMIVVLMVMYHTKMLYQLVQLII